MLLSQATPMASFLDVENNLYYRSRFVSYFLSLFGVEVDDLLACPTDTVPRIFDMVKL